MRLARTTASLALAAGALAGCSDNLPDEATLTAGLESRIESEAQGCLRLVEAKKTNGYPAPDLENTYVIVFEATVEFLRPCAWYSRDEVNKTFSDFRLIRMEDRKAFTISYETIEGAPGRRVTVAGEQPFLMTENGYVPVDADLGLNRVPSDAEKQAETAGRLFSLSQAQIAVLNDDGVDPWDEGADSRLKDILASLCGVSSETFLSRLRQGSYRFADAPEEDGWGNALEYSCDESSSTPKLVVRSPGRDGIFEPLSLEEDRYDPELYDRDLVLWGVALQRVPQLSR